jgi:hypothetical protein
MEIQSKTHRIVLHDDSVEFEVFALQPQELVVTEFSAAGVHQHTPDDKATRELLNYKNSTPLFAGNYAGDGQFNIDLDCGFQRWSGTKSKHEVREALKQCGFNKEEIGQILVAAMHSEHNYLRRY